jgi:protein-tyrosine kinase
MAKLMKEVANRYPDRLIIIDSPPPSLTSETGVLARMAEGIIIVVRHLRTDREEMKALVNQFGKEKIVGSVLNYFEDSTMSTKGYRYYRKYGDYTYG